MVKSRDRMISSAVTLFRQRGVAATSFSDVIEHSGAPRGSIYYYFPEGKAQLAEEATRRAGEIMTRLIAKSLEEHDAAGTIELFIEYWEHVLTNSGYGEGCPVVAAALAESEAPGARDAAAQAFGSWEKLIADALCDKGLSPARARALATTTVASVEGAIILARAKKSMEPLRRVGMEMQRLLQAEIASGNP